MKTTRSSTWVQKLIPSSRDVLEPDALIDVKRLCKPVNLFYHLVQSSWVESRVDWCSLPKWIIAWNETIPESVTNQRVYFNQNHFWSFMILFTDERLSKVWIIDFCPNLLAANSELEHSERCQIFLHRKVHPVQARAQQFPLRSRDISSNPPLTSSCSTLAYAVMQFWKDPSRGGSITVWLTSCLISFGFDQTSKAVAN